MKRFPAFIALCATALLMAGCASTPLDPTDPRDDIVAAELAFFGSLVAIEELGRAGVLDSDDARTIIPVLDAINAAIKAAHAAVDDGNLVDAALQAELARQKIREVSAFIREKRSLPIPPPRGTEVAYE